jgi:hypothetical protein
MTTRAKLTLCAGLLALAAGVVFVCAPARKPEVELRFVRYTNRPPASPELPWGHRGVFLDLTNRGLATVTLSCGSGEVLCHEQGDLLIPTGWPFDLTGHSGIRFVAWPVSPWPEMPSAARLSPTIQFRYWATRSPLRLRLELLLWKAWGVVPIAQTSTVVTVTLPPR